MSILFAAVFSWSIGKAQVQEEPPIYRTVFATPDEKNGYSDFVRACELTQTKDWSRLYEATNEAQIGSKNYLASRRALSSLCQPVIALVKSGNQKPVTDPRVNVSMSTTYPELLGFKAVARGLGLSAYAMFADGSNATASDTLIQGLMFSERISHCGPMITSLVARSSQAILLKVLAEHLERIPLGKWNELAQKTDHWIAASSALPTLEREFLYIKSTLRPSFDDPEDPLFSDETGFQDVIRKLNSDKKDRLARDCIDVLETVQRQYQAAMEADESQWAELSEAVTMEKLVGDKPLVKHVVESVLPVVGSLVRLELMKRTQLRLLRLHAAVMSYYWETGRYPNTLAEAGAPFISDPVSKEDFVYQRVQNTIELYSKGDRSTGRIDLVMKRPARGSETDPGGPWASVRSMPSRLAGLRRLW